MVCRNQPLLSDIGIPFRLKPPSALPLVGDGYGIRTRVTTVKGWCLSPLDQPAM